MQISPISLSPLSFKEQPTPAAPAPWKGTLCKVVKIALILTAAIASIFAFTLSPVIGLCTLAPSLGLTALLIRSLIKKDAPASPPPAPPATQPATPSLAVAAPKPKNNLLRDVVNRYASLVEAMAQNPAGTALTKIVDIASSISPSSLPSQSTIQSSVAALLVALASKKPASFPSAGLGNRNLITLTFRELEALFHAPITEATYNGLNPQKALVFNFSVVLKTDEGTVQDRGFALILDDGTIHYKPQHYSEWSRLLRAPVVQSEIKTLLINSFTKMKPCSFSSDQVSLTLTPFRKQAESEEGVHEALSLLIPPPPSNNGKTSTAPAARAKSPERPDFSFVNNPETYIPPFEKALKAAITAHLNSGKAREDFSVDLLKDLGLPAPAAAFASKKNRNGTYAIFIRNLSPVIKAVGNEFDPPIPLNISEKKLQILLMCTSPKPDGSPKKKRLKSPNPRSGTKNG
jgi:hypothetical protein